MKDPVIEEIIKTEFEMFQAVENEGGRADCQDDWPTFYIMRFSQFAAWNEAARSSYLNDLRIAVTKGRNLIAEKYAHMMAHTDPEGYAHIRDKILQPTKEQKETAQRINDEMMRQTEEYVKSYPFLSGMGRTVHATGDSRDDTSIETYQLGELYTYSMLTLEELDKHIRQLGAEGKNLPMEILSNTIQQYGYSSLDEAEAEMKQRSQETIMVPFFGAPCENPARQGQGSCPVPVR